MEVIYDFRCISWVEVLLAPDTATASLTHRKKANESRTHTRIDDQRLVVSFRPCQTWDVFIIGFKYVFFEAIEKFNFQTSFDFLKEFNFKFSFLIKYALLKSFDTTRDWSAISTGTSTTTNEYRKAQQNQSAYLNLKIADTELIPARHRLLIIVGERRLPAETCA